MARRLRQVLDRLLAGDSEKQIALALGISRHTVHTYVKALYRSHGVNSRGELLATYIREGVTGHLFDRNRTNPANDRCRMTFGRPRSGA